MKRILFTGLILMIMVCVLPVSAEVPLLTIYPQQLDFTLCYNTAYDEVKGLTLVNNNDFIVSYEAIDDPRLPQWGCIPLDLPWGDIEPYGAEGIMVHLTAICNCASPPVYPVGEYNSNIAIIQWPTASGGYFTTNVPVHYSIVNCGNSPEFPSSVLPIIIIIGFFGAVLLIQRTREQ